MSDRHTPEPWGTAGVTYPTADNRNYPGEPMKRHGSISQRGPFPAPKQSGTSISHDVTVADARRIIACVNAMAGIKDPAALLADVWTLIQDRRQPIRADIEVDPVEILQWTHELIDRVAAHLAEPTGEAD